jgi:hypothetical protein
MSPEELLAGFFAAVSFKPRPDYERIRALFIPAGLLIRPPGVMDLDAFIAPRAQSVESGELTDFEEYEISGRTDVFGDVAHRLSVYGKRGTRNGDGFEARGVISTQFVLIDGDWRISAMAWDDEREGLPLP